MKRAPTLAILALLVWVLSAPIPLARGLPLGAATPAGGAGGEADFDGDGFSDLAIGAVDEDVGNLSDAGAVNVIYGDDGGLSPALSPNEVWTQNSLNVAGAAEPGDQFGWALAIENFNDDAYDDLAIGVPDEDLGDIPNAGAVNVI